MKDWFDILDLIIEVIIVIIGIIIVYCKSYFKQKGTNVATKEDIGGITSEIEKVKSSINEMSLKKHDNFLEFKNAILDYNKESVKWMELSIKDISIADYEPENTEAIKQKLFNLQVQYSNVQIAYWKLFIFASSDNQQWFNSLHEKLSTILPLHNLTIDYLDHMCAYSAKISLLQESSEDLSMLITEIQDKRQTFIKKRDQIQGSAFKALRESSNLLKEKLTIYYNS